MSFSEADGISAPLYPSDFSVCSRQLPNAGIFISVPRNFSDIPKKARGARKLTSPGAALNQGNRNWHLHAQQFCPPGEDNSVDCLLFPKVSPRVSVLVTHPLCRWLNNGPGCPFLPCPTFLSGISHNPGHSRGVGLRRLPHRYISWLNTNSSYI